MRRFLRPWSAPVMVLVLLVSTLTALAHGKRLVVKHKKGNVEATVTLEPAPPHAGDDATLVVRVQKPAHEGGGKTHAPVTDATLSAHVGDAKESETSVELVHDDTTPGTYRGALRFPHAGKETFHVGITLAGKPKWLLRVAVTVKKKH